MWKEEAELRELVLPSAHPLTILLIPQRRALTTKQGSHLHFYWSWHARWVTFQLQPSCPDCRDHLSLREPTFNPVQETQYYILAWWLNIPDGYIWPRYCRVMNSMGPIFLLEKALRFKLLEEMITRVEFLDILFWDLICKLLLYH